MVVATADIKQPLLFNAKLGKDPTLELHVRANGCVVLVNTTEAELGMGPSNEICQFGNGKFKLLKKDEAPPAQSFAFKLSGDSDVIMVNGVTTSVGKAVAHYRKTKPDAQVRYHKVTVDQTNTEKMTLEATHHAVFFCCDLRVR